ncbi:MAG TPA: hypothetical protein VHX60_08560 [Acidobacteriaceae bacterium]|jgi:hypothetical protein|nr:hypothetical protein [Acidobacteriaceae bacterium]
MMTPVEAVRAGMGFDQAARWHEAKVSFFPARRSKGEDPIAPARGAIFGLLLSAGMWVGLVGIARLIAGLF